MAGGFLPPVVAELIAKTDGFTAKMGAARAEMEATSGRGAKAFTGLAAAGKVALATIAGSALIVGAYSVKMADQYEESHARLEVALKNSGTSWDAQRAKVEQASKTATRFGETKTQVEEALAVMVRGTGSTAKAFDMLSLAQDLSAAKGIDLSAAALMVTKASEGQLKPIKALGLDLPIAAAGAVKLEKAHASLTKANAALETVQAKVRGGLLKGLPAYVALANAQNKVHDAQAKVNSVSGAGKEILSALSDKLGGSAAAKADTFGGKVAQLHAKVANLGIVIGLWLIPKLLQIGEAIGKAVNWFQKHHQVAILLGVAVGTVLVAAITAYIASLVAAAAAQLVALAPIILIVAAIAALGVAIYLLVTHWDEVWKKVKEIVAAAWDWITTTVDSGYRAVLFFFESLPGRALDLLGKLPGALKRIGLLALEGLLAGAKVALPAALSFFANIPILILRGIGNLNKLLWRVGIDALHGLAAGAMSEGPKLIGWVAGLPGRILAAVPGAVKWLWNVGQLVITGLWAGQKAVFTNVVGWLSRLPGHIVSAIPNAGAILYHVGMLIIQGVWDGMKAVWHKVTSWLGGLAHAIVGLKGPPSVDAKLLHNNGLLIMDGFRRGLQQGWKGVESDLGGMTAQLGGIGMKGAVGGRGGGSALPAGNAAAGGAQAPPIQVVVHAGWGANGHQIGDEVVGVLKKWYQSNGPIPVKTA